jgi:predicted ester cyclase
MGMPPTGKRIDVNLIDIMRFNEAGMVCEHWGLMDMLSMMQQLGAIPEGPPA